MPQIINTNVASLNAQRNLNKSQSQLGVALQRLSSGLRINSAKDDAAGLAISDRFTTQIRGLDQAARNASDGISLSQTAESALGELTVNLQRIRELAVQSANSTNSSSDRAALNQEVQQRLAEIDRISSQTSFNGQKILDGTFGEAQFQIGANAGEVIKIDLTSSLRQNAIGAVASTSSQSLGASATGGSIGVATTALNFGTAAVTDTAGSLTVSAATRLFGTAASSGLEGRSDVKTFASKDFSTTAVPQVDGYNNQTLNTALGINTQATVSDAGLTGDYSGGGLGALTFTVDGNAVSVDSAVGTTRADFINDVQNDLGAGNYTVTDLGAGNGISIERVGGTQAVAIAGLNGNATTAGFVATAGTGTAGADQYDFSGGAIAQFEVDGIAVALTTDTTNFAGLKSAIEAQLAGYTVTENAPNDIRISKDGSLTAVAITNADANALSAGFANSAGSAGTAATPTTNGSITVDGQVLTFTGDHDSGNAATDLGTFKTELQGDLNTAFGANIYTVVTNADLTADELALDYGSGAGNGLSATQYFIRHENVTTAVNISAADSNAIQAGITVSAGAAGAGAVATTNATFTIDGYSITLDTDYATFDALAADLDTKLETANPAADGAYTVTNDNGTLTFTRGSVGNDTSIDITVADASATAAGFGVVAGDTGDVAGLTTNAQFKVDGTIVNLNADYADQAALIAAIEGQLSGYTVAAVDASNISITNDTTGSAAVVISDVEAGDTGYDAQKVTNAGTAGYLASLVGVAGTSAGEISIASGDLTIQVGDLTAVGIEGTFADVDALATYINSNVSGVFASEGAGGKLKLQSDREITLSGAEAVGGATDFAFAAANVAVNTGSLATATVATVTGSNDTITAIDSALTRVSSLRSNFGAIQSRFESTIANLTTTSENLSAARSRILDADFAQETAALTRTQILQQAGVSILSQANSLPQLALSLLQ